MTITKDCLLSILEDCLDLRREIRIHDYARCLEILSDLSCISDDFSIVKLRELIKLARSLLDQRDWSKLNDVCLDMLLYFVVLRECHFPNKLGEL